MTTLAYNVLMWIRANKKELYSQEIPAGMPPESEKKHRDLIHSLARYERKYRGMQNWLKTPNGDFPLYSGPNQHLTMGMVNAELSIMLVNMLALASSHPTLWESFCTVKAGANPPLGRLQALAIEEGLKATAEPGTLTNHYMAAAPQMKKIATFEIQKDKLILRLKVSFCNNEYFFKLPHLRNRTTVGELFEDLGEVSFEMAHSVQTMMKSTISWPSAHDIREGERMRASRILMDMHPRISREEVELLGRHLDLVDSWAQ